MSKRPPFINTFPATYQALRDLPVTPPSKKRVSVACVDPRRASANSTPRRNSLKLENSDTLHSSTTHKTAPPSPRMANSPRRSYSQRVFNLQKNSTFKWESQTLKQASRRQPFDSHQCSESIAKLKQLAIKFKPLGEIEDNQTFEDLIYELAYDRKKLAASKSFAECDNLNNAIDFVKQEQNKWNCEMAKKDAENEKEATIKQINSELDDFDKDTEAMVADLEREIDEERERLEKTHKEEVENHEKTWTERRSYEYNHPSGELLNKKKVIDHLIAQCRFQEAEKVQKEYDQMFARGTEAQHAQMQQAYDESLSALMEKQISQIETFEKLSKTKVDALKTSRGKERKGIENRFKKLEAPRVRGSFRDQMTTQRSIGTSNLPSVTIERKSIERDEPKFLPLPQLDLHHDATERIRKTRKIELY